jgi:hypothetical protein
MERTRTSVSGTDRAPSATNSAILAVLPDNESKSTRTRFMSADCKPGPAGKKPDS